MDGYSSELELDSSYLGLDSVIELFKDPTREGYRDSYLKKVE